jgi:inhibitor of the pro-sigma K processing machinery
METLAMVFLLIAAALSCVVIFKIAAAPIRLIFKLLLNALSGFMLLLLANLISGFFDFSVPINLLSCIVSGAFGIPGVALLILIQFIMM